MDFSAISSVNSYVKNLELQQKWKKRKETGNFTPEQTMLEKMIEDQRARAEGIPGTPKTDEQTLSKIHTKIMNGNELTFEEKLYLQNHDPVTYQQVKAAEAEQESYERELKSCKTKEEVDRVQMAHVNAALSTINTTRNSTELSESQEFGIIMNVKAKIEAIARITTKFMASGHYADLPTDEEKLKAEKTMKDAKDEELRPDTEEKTDAPPQEVTKPTEEQAAEAVQQATGEQAAEAVKTESEEKDVTIEEAENTPEMQKLKRAKARAAYANTKSYGDSEPTAGGKLNVSI